MPRRAAVDVEADRARTLRTAVDVASILGLEGLTIGRLAERLGMSKSGLAGRFGSKEQLQLATLELASRMFRTSVYDPAVGEPAGRARLSAICGRWITYLGEPVFLGGCFLTTASVEFDARQGAVHSAVQRTMKRWLRVLEAEAEIAVARDELSRDTDCAAVAFALNALAVGTNCDYQLHRDPRSLERGRSAMAAVLERPPTLAGART
jgi:AcrR family transcriptional regulator